MSTVLRPSGPHAARTYWIRRLLLVIVLAVAVWAVARWLGMPLPVGGADDGTSTPGAVASDPTAATTTPPDSEEREPQSPPEVVAGVRMVPVRFVDPVQECAPASVSVLPAVTDPVPAGEAVRLHLRVATTAASACTVDLDSGSLLVAISSGDEPVWSSAQCTSALPARTLVAQPHWSTLVDVTWSGQVTGNRCSLTAPWAPPGSYTVQAAILEGEPAIADFELAAPEATTTVKEREKKTKGDTLGDEERPQT